MKAYAIKNKEGKYFKQCFDNGYVDFTDNILFCELYAKRISAEDTVDFILRNKYKFNIENLEIVKITIAEGYLEQQLAEKDKKVDILSESGTVLKYDIHYNDVLRYVEDRLKRELLDRFYYEYLQNGKEYKCKLRIEKIEEESGIIKPTYYLYIKECKEDEEN